MTDAQHADAQSPTSPHPWGRVAEDGTVFVRDGDAEREVGQYPDATPDEAIGYFERKYADLEGQISLLEQRLVRGARASEVSSTVRRLTESVATANAVGDLGALRERLGRLGGRLDELTEKQSAEAAEASARAVADRTAIVEEAERLAAQDPAKIVWKTAGARLDELFRRWQDHQQNGPRIPKGTGNDLWRRFRDARSALETQRKAYYADLDETHKEARGRKQRLAERAEALAPKGAAGIPDYRTLLDEWKRAGRAGKKADDALWARFKAAGDVLFSAKAEVDAREDEEFRGNLDRKLDLLAEAEKLLQVRDRQKAKDALLGIQRRWDAIGKVPRDSFRQVEDRLKRVETHVRKLDEDHWKRTDPEKQARSEGMAAQLTAAIAQLEDQLEAARASGEPERVAEAEEALRTRRSWLEAIG